MFLACGRDTAACTASSGEAGVVGVSGGAGPCRSLFSLYLPFATGENLRFSRRVAPSPEGPMPLTGFLVQTFAASSALPTHGAAGNLRTPRATTSAVRQHARNRTALAGREQLQALDPSGDCHVWAWEIRAQVPPRRTSFLSSGMHVYNPLRRGRCCRQMRGMPEVSPALCAQTRQPVDWKAASGDRR